KKHAFSAPHKIAEGGATRFHSVKNGLKVVSSPDYIAIHDGVRPLVSHETITDCFAEAEISGAAIPVVDAVDSLRKITENGNVAVDRSLYKMVQTPQVFEAGLILEAYNQDFSDTFTDDASVVEAFGHKVSLVAGNRENIKITTQTDMLLAEAILKSK
ncbi:MAG: 2-C-methyl-D-erythritol 4-phosphate cytidylyltransferase, partial [Paludibacter sp.]|nr:2-C-methyl-D-erythritol 4-phosphate cytidylyltransferase [Paludibacter sp.]